MRNNGIIRKSVGSLLEDEAGIGVIELVLILVGILTTYGTVHIVYI